MDINVTFKIFHADIEKTLDNLNKRFIEKGIRINLEIKKKSLIKQGKMFDHSIKGINDKNIDLLR